MEVARFNASTGWDGKRITYESSVFVLEEVGPLTAAQVLEYDSKSQITWAYDGLKEWVAGTQSSTRARNQTTSPSGSESTAPSYSVTVLGVVWRIVLALVLTVVFAFAVFLLFRLIGISGVASTGVAWLLGFGVASIVVLRTCVVRGRHDRTERPLRSRWTQAAHDGGPFAFRGPGQRWPACLETLGFRSSDRFCAEAAQRRRGHLAEVAIPGRTTITGCERAAASRIDSA